MRNERSLEIGAWRIFSSFKGILLGPLNLPSFKDLIRVDTSSGVDAEINNDYKLGVDK